MRTNGCKNWRCRDYDTTMVLHCARSISKTDDRPYAVICNAYMPRVHGKGKRTLEHWKAGTRIPLVITQEGALNCTDDRPRHSKTQTKELP